MTRLLCTADWHAGAGPQYGRAPADRLADQAAAYQAIADLAIEHHVDALLFAGDLTHRNLPTPAALGAAKDALERVLNKGIPVIAISGNSHDVAHTNERIGLELVTLPGFTVHRRPAWCRTSPHGMAVACLPWTPDTRLMAASDADRSVIRATMSEHLIASAALMRAKIGHDTPAILMLHYSVTGGVSASGAQAELFGETVLPLSELVAQRWTAVVCGHLHRWQVLHESPPVFYCGPPAIVDFGEAGQPHGCVLLEIDDATGVAKPPRHVEIPGRPFVTYELDPTFDPATTERGDAFQDAVVRVRYTATPEQARLVDHTTITKALYDAGAHKVYKIEPTILRADRGRLDQVLEHVTQELHDTAAADGAPIDAGSLTPLQAIEAWILSQDLDADAAAALRARTTAYLEGRTPTIAEPQEAAA